MKFASVADLSYALVHIAEKENFIEKKRAALNEKVANLTKKFEEDTQEAQEEINLLKEDLTQYCEKNKKTIFEKEKSLSFSHGSIGYRTGPSKLAFLNSKYDTESVLVHLRKFFNDVYVRIKEEIDKPKILSAYKSNELNDEKLARVGLKVEQEETFFIKTN